MLDMPITPMALTTDTVTDTELLLMEPATLRKYFDSESTWQHLFNVFSHHSSHSLTTGLTTGLTTIFRYESNYNLKLTTNSVSNVSVIWKSFITMQRFFFLFMYLLN